MQNIILCGFMGSGKSTVGPLIAAALGRRFADMDRLIEERAGKTIPEIFSEQGEAAFRAMEQEVCRDLSRQRDLVVASGGGAPLFSCNRLAMEQDILIFLDVSLPNILLRTQGETGRPLIDGQKNKEKTIRLYEERLPLYRRYAAYTADANGSAEETAEAVLQCCKSARIIP